MSRNDVEKKWDKIYAAQKFPEQLKIKPANVLHDYAHLLPTSGLALDLACGLGGNAIFLAKHGLISHAWDISQTAIDRLQVYSLENNFTLVAEVRDIEAQPPTANSFDVICVSYYLERSLCDSIIAALKPSGVLFYQTFTSERVTDDGPSNPQYRLQSNELLALFSPLHVLVYQELGAVENVKKGLRDVALLVAQKR